MNTRLCHYPEGPHELCRPFLLIRGPHVFPGAEMTVIRVRRIAGLRKSGRRLLNFIIYSSVLWRRRAYSSASPVVRRTVPSVSLAAPRSGGGYRARITVTSGSGSGGCCTRVRGYTRRTASSGFNGPCDAGMCLRTAFGARIITTGRISAGCTRVPTCPAGRWEGAINRERRCGFHYQ